MSPAPESVPCPVPPEIAAHIEKLCDSVFDALKQTGNDKQSVEIMIEKLLSSIQTAILHNIQKFPLRDANNLNVDMVLVTTLIRVVFNNPMWESEALTLQFKQECKNIVRGAGGIPLEVKNG